MSDEIEQHGETAAESAPEYLIGIRLREPLMPEDYLTIETGLGVGDIDHVVLRDRKHLASDGMVVVILAMEKQTGRVVGRPEVVSRGFVDMDESDDLIERTRARVLQALEGADHIVEWGAVHTSVKDAVAKFLYDETRRRPMVLPVAMEV